MHFHLEQHTCYAKPIEDGQIEVYPATQWIDKTATFISNALKIPLHNFDMKVRIARENSLVEKFVSRNCSILHW